MHFRLAILSFAVIALSSPLCSLSAAWKEARYEGILISKPRDKEPETVRRFTVSVLLNDQRGDRSNPLFWKVDDEQTGWHWPESFGWDTDQLKGDGTGREAALLYEHDQSPWPIPLVPLAISLGDSPKQGLQWERGRMKLKLLALPKGSDGGIFSVEVSSNFGRAGTARYEAETGLLVESERKLFLGRGDEFELTLKRKSLTDLDAERAEKVSEALGQLKEIQEGLKRNAEQVRSELSAEQLAFLAERIEAFESLAENTSLQSLAVEMHRDLNLQSQRSENVAAVAKEAMKKNHAQLKLTKLDGNPLPASETEGRILVLHFWKYHQDPLQEPYGQVGYFDFLHNKRKKMGVTVLGVAVDPAFEGPGGARTMQRAVKKLASFMNLSYTLLKDEGGLLKQIGDPRPAGAELPLTVVIGPKGRVLHYHSGLYEVNPREGLKELDDVLIEEIRKLKNPN